MEVLQAQPLLREYWNLVELTLDTITVSRRQHVQVQFPVTFFLDPTPTLTSEN